MTKSTKKQSTGINPTYVLIVFVLIFVAAFGYKSLKPSSQIAQPIGINEVTSLGYASLAISPVTEVPSGLYPLTGKTPMQITIDAGLNGTTPNKLVAATVELSYDPTKMIISNMVKGSFFTNTFSTPVIDSVTKKATFSFAVAPSDGGKSGTGVLATFDVQPIVSGPMDITFAAPTKVSAEGYTENILKVADSFTLTGKPIMTTYNFDTKTNVITVILDNDSEPKDKISVYKLSSVTPINIGATLPLKWVYENNTQVARLDTVTAQPSPIITLQMTPANVSATGTFVVAYSRLKADGKYKILDQRVVTREARVASDIVYDSNTPTDLVNAQDYVQFVVDFGKTNAKKGWIRSDINTDGAVNIADYPTFVGEWSL